MCYSAAHLLAGLCARYINGGRDLRPCSNQGKKPYSGHISLVVIIAPIHGSVLYSECNSIYA